MVIKLATDYWIYGEYGDGFGKSLNAFFTPREGDDLHSLQKASEPENLILADLKLNFRFTEFLFNFESCIWHVKKTLADHHNKDHNQDRHVKLLLTMTLFFLYIQYNKILKANLLILTIRRKKIKKLSRRTVKNAAIYKTKTLNIF